MKLKLALGMNRVKPPHELVTAQDGYTECSLIQNMVCRDGKLTKIGGTQLANSPSVLSNPIPWVHRSYHKRADNSYRKVTFCYSGTDIYWMNDVTGALTSCWSGLWTGLYPQHFSFQVAGNTELFFIPGRENVKVLKYDGNGDYTWVETDIAEDIGRTPIQMVDHLDRAWIVSENSSTLAYSRTLYPQDFSVDAADIVVGNETDSVIRAVGVAQGETLYVFKNNSIWQLWNRTPATFQFRKVTDKYGLAEGGPRALCYVGSGFIFQNEFDKELYFFGGNETSIQPLTEDTIRLRDIIDKTQHELERVAMTVHDGLFRFAFKHREDAVYPNRELIYAVNDPSPQGGPRWTMSEGANILSYTVMDKQDDRNDLITGHSSTGKLLWHNRGKNFDEHAIVIRVRTAEVIASEEDVVRFKGFWLKGKTRTTTNVSEFRYFLNGRYSLRGQGELNMEGETRSMGTLRLSQQVLFNDRIIPLHDWSRGNSISFEFYDDNLSSDFEMYSIAFDAKPRYQIRNQLI